MILRYLMDDTGTHYVSCQLDLPSQQAVASYVKGGTVQISRVANISNVMEVDSLHNPTIQVAKKGRIWDFHIAKKDAYGITTRKSISLFLSEILSPIKAEMENESPDTITLKDYLSNPLEVYKSPMTVAVYNFDDIERMTGISDQSMTSPEITLDDQLKIGFGGDVTLLPTGEDTLDFTIPAQLFFIVDSFAANDASGTPQLDIVLGTNTLSLDTTTGISFNTLNIAPPTSVYDGMKIRLDIGSVATMWIDETPVSLTGFDRTPISGIQFKGGCNNGVYTLLDQCIVHKVEDYRLDAIPPTTVANIKAVAGYGEVILTWDANTETDLAGYNVYVNGILHNLEMIIGTEFQAAGITDGLPNRFVVTAIDKAGNESPSNEILEVTTSTTPEREVSAIESYVTSNGAYFFWTVPTYADFAGIKVYRINLLDDTKIELASLEPTITNYVDTPKPISGNYKYVISTVDVYGTITTGIEIIQYISPSTPTPEATS